MTEKINLSPLYNLSGQIRHREYKSNKIITLLIKYIQTTIVFAALVGFFCITSKILNIFYIENKVSRTFPSVTNTCYINKSSLASVVLCSPVIVAFEKLRQGK